MTLTEKVVVVTGSSRGIGQAIARQFALAGCRLVLNARKALPEVFTQELAALQTEFIVVLGDVADEATATAICTQSLEKFGRIDVLVNNAGITNDKLLRAMSMSDFTDVLNVNLVGTFNLTKVVLKPMYKQRAGCIINIASVIGQHGNIGQANYAASKAGIIGLTQSTAKEGAMRQVRCNAIAPGMIETDMTAALKPQLKEAILAEIPLKRFGHAEEVAQAALFLAENEYVTGQVITVDGGMTI